MTEPAAGPPGEGAAPPGDPVAVRVAGVSRRRRRSGDGELPMVPEARPRSYYGHPIIRAPIWRPEVAAYLFTGGLAGASSMLAAAARRAGDAPLARRALLIAAAAASVGPPLLIADLGVPRRFANMLRVVKVTSPMSIGTWALAGTGSSLGVAVACELTARLPRLQRTAENTAALLGPVMSTYTAVLLADTAVPAWRDARTTLPFVFGAGALASAGAAAVLLTDHAHAAPARRLAVAGALAEAAAAAVMERRLGDVGEPYRTGAPGRFATAGRALGLAGSALVAAGRWRPTVARGGGAMVLAGSMCARWAVFTAGRVSAMEPRFTVDPQRRRLLN